MRKAEILMSSAAMLSKWKNEIQNENGGGGGGNLLLGDFSFIDE